MKDRDMDYVPINNALQYYLEKRISIFQKVITSVILRILQKKLYWKDKIKGFPMMSFLNNLK